MRLIHSAFVAIVSTALIGCASTPPQMQAARPASALTQSYGLAKIEAVGVTNHMQQPLDSEQSVIYFQNQGGGGAGLGLLLGPVGVLANIKMIQGVTDSDVAKLKGKLTVDPKAALQEAQLATQSPLRIAATPGDVKVSPFLLVSKTSETTVQLSSVLMFEGTEGQAKWNRRYQYQLPGKYTLEQLSTLSPSSLADVQSASVAAYAALLKHIAEEQPAAIAAERPVTLKSAFISPRFELEMQGTLIGEKDQRIWVRTIGSVIAVEPSDIKYQLSKT